MMSRSTPSYGPADITASRDDSEDGRQDSGVVTTAAQQAAQTGPCRGSSSTDPHDAQAGASTIDSAALAAQTMVLFADRNAFGRSPEALETIELARGWREDVEDEVEVIEQHPLRLVV